MSLGIYSVNVTVVVSSVAGGRTSQAIVDEALKALHSLVKDRLGGRTGGSDSSRQVCNAHSTPASVQVKSMEIDLCWSNRQVSDAYPFSISAE